MKTTGVSSIPKCGLLVFWDALLSTTLTDTHLKLVCIGSPRDRLDFNSKKWQNISEWWAGFKISLSNQRQHWWSIKKERKIRFPPPPARQFSHFFTLKKDWKILWAMGSPQFGHCPKERVFFSSGKSSPSQSDNGYLMYWRRVITINRNVTISANRILVIGTFQRPDSLISGFSRFPCCVLE